jgi:hypothetical protein
MGYKDKGKEGKKEDKEGKRITSFLLLYGP